jgi:protein SCO1
MSQVNRRELLGGLAALPFVSRMAAASDEPAPATSQVQGKFAPRLSGREMLRRRYFPDVELVTSEGKTVKFYEDLLKDKIVILNMMYADCEGICPTITANLKRVHKILKQQIDHDIFIYSLTINPEKDTPAKLKEYADMHDITDPHWLFLTGKPDQMDVLRHSIGYADPDPKIDKDKSKHSGMLRYGNEPMAIWGTCQGSGEPEWIAQEIGFAIPRQFKKHPAVNE